MLFIRCMPKNMRLMATGVHLNPRLSHGISYVRGGVEPLKNHNGGDNGNGILKILKMSLHYQALYLCHLSEMELCRFQNLTLTLTLPIIIKIVETTAYQS